jgi:hypothetical protein
MHRAFFGLAMAIVLSQPAQAQPSLQTFDRDEAGIMGCQAGLIQSPPQASLLVLSAWVEVGGIASSLCWKALPVQPIST